MKKFFKLGKRMLALFIVVLLNINSYAAVGANDGSAFVTKAEFDALVNTFNEQMDTYQSGINAKIDGAIANYLAGLSSQQTSEVPFYDGMGMDAYVLNFDKMNDMIIAKGSATIAMSISMMATKNDCSNTMANFTISRNNVQGGESFLIKDGQLKLLGRNINVSINANMYCMAPATWSSYTYSKSFVNFRWSANSNASFPGLTKKLNKEWVKTYATGLNCGTESGQSTNTSTTVNLKKDDSDHVSTVFDMSLKTDNKVFGDYKNNGNYASQFGWDWDDETKDYYINYLKSSTNPYSQYYYETPAAAGFTTSGQVLVLGQLSQQSVKTITNIGWTNKGSWSQESGTADIKQGWYEPVLKLKAGDPASIRQQSFTTDLLKKYNPKYNDPLKTNNWEGYLTQGIPICRFDDSGKATFEIDTTPLGGTVGAASVVAFSTKAFERTAVLDTFTRDGKITTIKVDNNIVSGGSVVLTPGKHEFEIHMTPSSGGDTLFMKVAYPSSVTTSIRNVFTLPKSVMLTIG